MEMLLKELGSASKLLSDFKDMYEYENRLKTFTNWPFIENCKCTPENVLYVHGVMLRFLSENILRSPGYGRSHALLLKCLCSMASTRCYLVEQSYSVSLQMAKAGFVHCPNANEPDVAKCFFCLIELEGWEPNDDPWEEHTKRHSCGFLSLSKHFDDLTMEEYYRLEMTRLRTFLCKTGRSIINSFEEEVTATRQRLVDNFVSKHQYTPPPPVPLHADPAAQHSESSYCQSKKIQEK